MQERKEVGKYEPGRARADTREAELVSWCFRRLRHVLKERCAPGSSIQNVLLVSRQDDETLWRGAGLGTEGYELQEAHLQ